MLLIKKARGPYIGMLDLPGGRLEHGEEPLAALKREFDEEAKVTVQQATLHDVFTVVTNFTDERGDISMYQVGIIFMVTEADTSSMATEMNDQDSLGAEWFDVRALKKMNLSPFAKRALQEMTS